MEFVSTTSVSAGSSAAFLPLLQASLAAGNRPLRSFSCYTTTGPAYAVIMGKPVKRPKSYLDIQVFEGTASSVSAAINAATSGKRFEEICSGTDAAASKFIVAIGITKK